MILVIRPESIAQRLSAGWTECCRLRIGYELDNMSGFGLSAYAVPVFTCLHYWNNANK